MGTTTIDRPFAPSLPRPTRAPRFAPHTPRPRTAQRSTGRLGSQQVVSIRGRRVAEVNRARHAFTRVTAVAVPLLIFGVIVAMVLSGLSTGQAFRIQELQARERALGNEVETLNRDAESLKSSSHLAKGAAEAGMVVSQQPGILTVAPDGAVTEARPFNPEATQPLTDAASDNKRPGDNRATSDRDATAQVGDQLTQVPGGNVLGRDGAAAHAGAGNRPGEPAPAVPAAPAGAQQGNLAPYAPRIAPGR
ncbi:hypothetical protein C3E79_07580 [Corynebacterium liangguodongii]|uniref:Uncharacterized protein n=2 Tax=Corynebacterium liangguodongii TaxID=2079535 RepID=A0A2S0WF18_9CORY|nr:hypothetical protein C3E79_07580 [Corynebacterium liangguodongii]PWB99849.1 hypothetical protein DF219_04175 [Corynebacterium liangguodongii]